MRARARELFAVLLPLAALSASSAASLRPDVRRYRPLPAPETGALAPVDPEAVRAMTNQGAGAKPRDAGISLARSGRATFLVYNLEFESPEACEGFKPEGIQVFNRFDRFADVYVPYESGQQLAQAQTLLRAASGLVRAEGIGAISPPPAPRPQAVQTRSPAEPEPIVRGGLDGLTGRGVVIAVVDSGIDFRHPDFIATGADGKPVSRVLYLWDTTRTFAEGAAGRRPPLSYPDGTPVGTLYTREQLTAELRASTPSLPPMDTDSHGTACAGIAAGNGAGSGGRYAGAAPNADLMVVKVTDDAAGTQNTYLLNYICGWVDRVAGERPAVVSCSFGGHFGGHDGNLVEERQLSARFAPSVKGRALCIAAGNDAARKIHAEAAFSDEKNPGRLAWSSETGGQVNVFFDTGRTESLAYAPLPGAGLRRAVTDYNPITRQACLQLSIEPGSGGITLTNTRGEATRCDAYIQGGSFEAATPSRMVCTPGLAANAITVGSYDWNDVLDSGGRSSRLLVDQKPLLLGGLSGYSNPGPSRDARATVKPEVAAPGQFFVAPAAKDAAGKVVRPDTLLDGTGSYRLFSGTSAAAPYVAGVAALLFERKPTLSVGELKALLRASASRDAFTGDVPNGRWGFGKLDLKAVRAALSSLH